MYRNVYEKGALIGMCLDLSLMKYSKGILNLAGLIKQLSEKYGKEKAFKDDDFIDDITAMTFPEIGTFLNVMFKVMNHYLLKSISLGQVYQYVKVVKKDWPCGVILN